MTRFSERLLEAQRARKSVLCVGLDPDVQQMPKHLQASQSPAKSIKHFNEGIIQATAPFACAFKLNFAFYEALGAGGHEVLRHTLDCIPEGLITIADAKRGDIGNSARQYAHAILGELGFDACTVAPYMGHDAVLPFLQYEGRAAFVLTRTSNASAKDFQEVPYQSEPLFHLVARHVNRWNEASAGTAGLVVGATSPSALRSLRKLCPTLPFLIPGIGAQGGAPGDIAPAAMGPVIVSSSRAILYASNGTDFADRAAQAARHTRNLLTSYVSATC